MVLIIDLFEALFENFVLPVQSFQVLFLHLQSGFGTLENAKFIVITEMA